ncbi:hypothetical protein BDZ91DRAFT_759355 [Kalaharituber pfeilii]|nr:hypothetical protein BDZ91DRAFT_759355 [Kalaharituber pfeilii]
MGAPGVLLGLTLLRCSPQSNRATGRCACLAACDRAAPVIAAAAPIVAADVGRLGVGAVKQTAAPLSARGSSVAGDAGWHCGASTNAALVLLLCRGRCDTSQALALQVRSSLAEFKHRTLSLTLTVSFQVSRWWQQQRRFQCGLYSWTSSIAALSTGRASGLPSKCLQQVAAPFGSPSSVQAAAAPSPTPLI